jgi:hemolysin III
MQGCRIGVHKRLLSNKEEIANGVSHGIALVGCLVATPFLLSSAARPGDAWNVAGTAVFAGAMIFMCLSSALYHVLPENRTKRVLRVLDHIAICGYLYSVYFGRLAWRLGLDAFQHRVGFGSPWCGAEDKGSPLAPLHFDRPLSGNGLADRGVRPLWLKMPLPGIFLLLAGGIAYTGGVVFYAAERVRYCHFIWHLFVVMGTTCHFFAVL